MKRNLVEWAVLVASVVMITALVAALVWTGLSQSRPANPQVELHIDRAHQGTLGWILPATVSNDGDEAAEAITLEAQATVDGEPEVSELEVPFLAAGSSAELAFSFSAPPSDEVTVRLVGLRLP